MGMTLAGLLVSLLVALSLVRLAIGYAHRRGMLDQPGQRRSHTMPTPRGGGIGIVVAMLVCLAGLGWRTSSAWPWTVAGGMVLVACAGWWDDHRPLPALPRLAAHLIASGGFSIAVLAGGMSWWWLPLLVLAGAWSINLHNFMDGIDGLLAQQAIFVGAGLMLLAGAAGAPSLMVAAACMAAAAAGFWWFNRPPARIFMGDVGSGSSGFVLFALTALLWRTDPATLLPALILSCAFIVDASLTLLSRMLRGRRWLAAHREHLYQWLARRQRSHAKVDAGYLGWNMLVVAPSAWLAWSHLQQALPITITVYLVAAALWLALKRRCLQRRHAKERHVAA